MYPVQIVGHIGREPELKENKNKKPYTVLNVATYAGKDVKGSKQTQWVGVWVHGKLAVTVTGTLQKGSYIQCCGFLREPSRYDRDSKPDDTAQMVALEINRVTKGDYQFENITEKELVQVK